MRPAPVSVTGQLKRPLKGAEMACGFSPSQANRAVAVPRKEGPGSHRSISAIGAQGGTGWFGTEIQEDDPRRTGLVLVGWFGTEIQEDNPWRAGLVFLANVMSEEQAAPGAVGPGLVAAVQLSKGLTLQVSAALLPWAVRCRQPSACWCPLLAC